jgi:DNA polymerase III delta prime subunit
MIFRENMEIDNKGINFIFSTNSIFKINTAIISRCVPLKLKLVSEHCLMTRMIEILNKEDMKPTLEEVILLMKIGNGDVRKTIDLISGRLVGDMIDNKYFSHLSRIYPDHKTPDILFKENRLEVLRKMRVMTEQKNVCLYNFRFSANITGLMI